MYRYFNTKEGLFNALKEDTVSEFVEHARHDMSQEDDVLKIIECVIKNYLSFFERNSAFFQGHHSRTEGFSPGVFREVYQ